MSAAAAPFLVLTGERGVGKSHVCSALRDLAAARGVRCGGFLTRRDLDESGGTSGLSLEEVATAARHRLGATGEDLGGPRVGPFSMDDTIVALGIRLVRASLAARVDLVIIDEIGPLELTQGLGFAPLIPLIAQHPRSAVVVVARPSLVDALRWRCAARVSRVETVTCANRDSLPPLLWAQLWATSPPDTPV